MFFQLYLIYAGAIFASNRHIHEAWGLQFASYGGIIIFVGLVSQFNVPLLAFGVRRHNRFVLISAFWIDVICLSVLIKYGLEIMSYSTLEYSVEFRDDCMSPKPLINTPEQCAEYFRSDRVAGFRAYWSSYYTDRVEIFSFQQLALIQGDFCCGFFPPMECVEDPRPYPSNFLIEDLAPEMQTQRVSCGNVAKYYPDSPGTCTVYDDLTAIPPILGGCNYDLGVSYCLTNEPNEFSKGCAQATEEVAISLIFSHGLLTAGLTIFNFLSMVWACCMYWKRKEIDVFPSAGDNAGVNLENPKLDFFKTPNQFEVVPKSNYLKVVGFLPYSARELKLMDRLNKYNESVKVVEEKDDDKESVDTV